MKNTLMIDMDTDREDVIRISKPEAIGDAVDDSEKARLMVLDDLTTVCNALGTLIHLAHTNKYMEADTACNMCIDFLTDNFKNKDEPKEGDVDDLETPKEDE